MATTTVNEYLQAVPEQARVYLGQLRDIAKAEAPEATEVVSYGILGYKLPGVNRAFVYVSGYAQHVSIYPIPSNLTDKVQAEVAPFVAGKGTLKFSLAQPLPLDIVRLVVRALYAQASEAKR